MLQLWALVRPQQEAILSWLHPCNKSPSAIAGVRTYESVPLYADRYSGGYSGSAIVTVTVVPL